MAPPAELPKTMKALVLESTSKPPTVEAIPVPQPSTGSAVVRILAACVLSYARGIFNGTRGYPFPTPLVPGSSAIGRVAAVGPDATKVQPGQLVFIDSLITARDDPESSMLGGILSGVTAGSQKLMTDVYRNWTYAEYCLCPLESIAILDEARLLGDPRDGRGLGLKLEQLCYIKDLIVPYGGLRDIELRAGQTVIIAPATGPFDGAAVLMAQAMGARVIAMGRNVSVLESLKAKVLFPQRLETVPITGDVQGDCDALKKHGRIDAYFDIGPAAAAQSSHIKSAILALRHKGRVSLMGGYTEDVPFPHRVIMFKSLRLYGKFMYERSDIADCISMVENGMLDLGIVKIVGEYPLEEWKEAWDAAAEKAAAAEMVLIKP